MKSRLYNADITPMYTVKVTVSGQEDEYGTPYTTSRYYKFLNKEDAKKAMMHFFKDEHERWYQNEVSIGSDEITLTVKGCEYEGGDKVCHFSIESDYMFNELPACYAD